MNNTAQISKRLSTTPDLFELRQQKKHYVFVYGTLKIGFSNHKYHLSDANYMGIAETKDKDFVMLTNGGFPILLDGETVKSVNIPDDRYKKLPVLGELFEVDADNFISLDQLEGNNSLYTRKKVKFVMRTKTPMFDKSPSDINNDEVEAWVYIITPSYAKNLYENRPFEKACKPVLKDKFYSFSGQ